MGKRGPKKTPSAIKRKRGTYRPDRDSGIESAPANPATSPPAFLTDEAIEAWDELVPLLEKNRILTELDVIPLALLCQAWADWREAIEHIKRSGIVACSESGNEYQAPAVGVRNKAWAMVLKGCQEFGLTPSSRTGFKLNGDKDDEAEDKEVAGILGI